jgi:diaminohydroxyphosphoribosylaminopyrimidine deaminase/5-amino-6-(5-phosphoribosylamino)uracil reductase
MAASRGKERFSEADEKFMRRALGLARRGYGGTSPNPMVGAVLVRGDKIVGEGWHQRAGEPHAEINAIQSALRKSTDLRGSVLYVTLEPCSSHGRTPACTDAIIHHGISRVVVAATDPNPNHAGNGFRILKQHRVEVAHGLLAAEAERLNESFNHWIVTKRPFIVLKAAMSLDGKIATVSGESKWITSAQSREHAMRLRLGADAILVGINTILRDNPSLTLRPFKAGKIPPWKKLTRIVLDREAKIPRNAAVLKNQESAPTILVTSKLAPTSRLKRLRAKVRVVVAPLKRGKFDLPWLMELLGRENMTNLLVEGGGETHANFLEQELGNRIAFFYAPKIIGGRNAPKAIGGDGLLHAVPLVRPEWSQIGPDLFLTACIERTAP